MESLKKKGLQPVCCVPFSKIQHTDVHPFLGGWKIEKKHTHPALVTCTLNLTLGINSYWSIGHEEEMKTWPGKDFLKAGPIVNFILMTKGIKEHHKYGNGDGRK